MHFWFIWIFNQQFSFKVCHQRWPFHQHPRCRGGFLLGYGIMQCDSSLRFIIHRAGGVVDHCITCGTTLVLSATGGFALTTLHLSPLFLARPHFSPLIPPQRHLICWTRYSDSASPAYVSSPSPPPSSFLSTCRSFVFFPRLLI